MKICPRCNAQVNNAEKSCKQCGLMFVQSAQEEKDSPETKEIDTDEEKTGGMVSSDAKATMKNGMLLPVILLIILGVYLYGILMKPSGKAENRLSNDSVNEDVSVEQVLMEEKQEIRVLGPESSFAEYLEGAREVLVSEAHASSTIYQAGRSNAPELLFDKNDMTNWQEGVQGYGLGEAVTVYFGSPREIRMISFKNGNWYYTPKKGHDYYYNGNCRPKILRLDLDGKRYLVPFQDVMAEQLVVFKYPVYCESMTVQIVEVYPGTRFDDTVITEITPYEKTDTMPFPESDGSWISDQTGVWYMNSNGFYTMDGWQTIDGSLYFFDSYGYVVTNRWVELNGNSYFLGEDGRLLTDGTAPDGSRVDLNGIKQ